MITRYVSTLVRTNEAESLLFRGWKPNSQPKSDLAAFTPAAVVLHPRRQLCERVRLGHSLRETINKMTRVQTLFFATTELMKEEDG
jgi:hypothetical protein